jgi:hypothetical protein
VAGCCVRGNETSGSVGTVSFPRRTLLHAVSEIGLGFCPSISVLSEYFGFVRVFRFCPIISVLSEYFGFVRVFRFCPFSVIAPMIRVLSLRIDCL